MSVREIAEEIGIAKSVVHRMKQKMEREAKEVFPNVCMGRDGMELEIPYEASVPAGTPEFGTKPSSKQPVDGSR